MVNPAPHTTTPRSISKTTNPVISPIKIKQGSSVQPMLASKELQINSFDPEKPTISDIEECPVFRPSLKELLAKTFS
jgi:hypothetical protein